MYKAIINNKRKRNVIYTGNNRLVINDKDFIIEKFGDDADFILVKNGIHQFKVIVHDADFKTNTFQLRIHGIKHTVKIKDKFGQLLEELGLNSKASATINHIKAPMPGLILEVNVNSGDDVKKGDKVLVLEAMKMENVIRSPGKGKVSEVKVVKGDSVEKNQILIRF